jgi:hypothetical protein
MIKLSVYHICQWLCDLETDEPKNTESVKTKHAKAVSKSHRLTSQTVCGKPSASLWKSRNQMGRFIKTQLQNLSNQLTNGTFK